jgi:hypothetical protein
VSDLADLVPALKRELAAPGDYATTFPNSTDSELTARLADAFALAQLDGFFADVALDVDELTVDPDLSAAGGALIVLYAAMQVIRSAIRATQASFRAKAGPVEYEVQRSATLLRDELKYLNERMTNLVAQAVLSSRQTFVMDAYLNHIALDLGSIGGFYAYELCR